ncbi:MAG: NAD-dependent epimerase/dehydratase family protein [Alphaproteobacteria bacterium]
MSELVALTGITGFIGGHLARGLADAGWRVRALARREVPPDLARRVEVVHGALEDEASLAALVEGAGAVVHCAGAIKARSRGEFLATNATGTGNLAAAAAAARRPPRFVLLSSLAAREPALSDYTYSKREGERELAARGAALDWTILRLPAVYGPGDRATLAIFRQARYGVAFLPGPRAGRFSMIYVADLVDAVVRLLEARAGAGATMEIDDGCSGGYTWRRIAVIAAAASGRKIVCIHLPRSLVLAVSAVNRMRCHFTGAAPLITPGKVRELYHTDWVCRDDGPIGRVGWRPAVTAEDGFARTVAWYRNEGWL